VGQVSLCPRHPKQYVEQLANETTDEQSVRYRHAGIESAIGGLQRGNGLDGCRNRSEVGIERYLGLGVLSRNMQVLGKLFISREIGSALAGYSLREAGYPQTTTHQIAQATKLCLAICDRARKLMKMISLISDHVP